MSALGKHPEGVLPALPRAVLTFVAPVFVRPAAEAVPQTPAAPPHLDRDSHRLDGVGSSKGNATVVPPQGRPAASRD